MWKKFFEDRTEAREHIMNVAKATEALATQTLVSVTIIDRALLCIGQNLVCF